MSTSDVFTKDSATSGSVQAPPSKRPREDSEEVLEMREEMRQLRGDIGGIGEKLVVVLDAVGRMMSELEGMRGTVGKILKCTEGHELRLKNIEKTLSRQATEMTEMRERTNKLEGSMKEMKKTVKNVEGLERKLKEMEKRERDLEWRAVDNEARSRRNNLLFYGIPEQEGENCDDVIRGIVRTELKLNPSGLIIQRAHRLRVRKTKNAIGQSTTKPRPVIVNFLNFTDKEKIRSLHYKLSRPLGISEDLPLEVRKARESLIPELRELKNRGKKASIVYPARLISEGQVIKDLNVIDFKYK